MPRRKIIQIDEEKCDGCGSCVIACAEGALEIIDGKARLVSETYCDGLGACIGDCPRGALTIVESDADDFDAAAVEEHLSRSRGTTSRTPPVPCECPSAINQSMEPRTSLGDVEITSQLSHWPVQLHLVNPEAQFFGGEELVVAADCVPVAYGAFHRDYLSGRKVVIACPKLDDPSGYVEKLTTLIDHGGISGIKIVHMQVPCCFGLRRLVEIAASRASRKVPIEDVVISVDGTILSSSSLMDISGSAEEA